MNDDFGQATESILKIMENILALKTKIALAKKGENINEGKLKTWEKELYKAEKALEKRRIMA